MDTLALMGNATEFERAVDWCLALLVDTDQTVSVFETNIRALGGLLSAHVLAADASLAAALAVERLLDGYVDGDGGGGLLASTDLARPAAPRVRHAERDPVRLDQPGERRRARRSAAQCTAAAGSLLLEFGALSG